MPNNTDPLDLYANIEDLLGLKEASPKLYAHYLLYLQSIDFDSLLDVGCGSGDFLVQMQKALDIPQTKGIDLSPLMIEKSLAKGLDASCSDLCTLAGKYDVITAVFDMLNYLDKEALGTFLACVSAHLPRGGVFLCDINTLYGFENVAVGSFIVDDGSRFLAIDSDFEAGVYHSEFTVFTQEKVGFSKSQETIKQYYHEIEELNSLALSTNLSLISEDEVFLYDLEEADKHFLVLQKI
ncbi:MAG: class I SAM-dependent methyltransferase [Sulfurovum sp.]|nr:class I SAM-dependent methyltransferase [Sulfurovum sp.]